jgi:hypothetical protein
MKKQAMKTIAAQKVAAAPAPGTLVASYLFNTKILPFMKIAAEVGPQMEIKQGTPYIHVPPSGNGFLRNTHDKTIIATGNIVARVIQINDFIASAVGRLWLFSDLYKGIFINPDGSVSETMTGTERIIAGAGTIIKDTPVDLELDLGASLLIRNFGASPKVSHSCWKGSMDQLDFYA